MNNFKKITKTLLLTIALMQIFNSGLLANEKDCQKCAEHIAKTAEYYNKNKCEIISQVPEYKHTTYMYMKAEQNRQCRCLATK